MGAAQPGRHCPTTGQTTVSGWANTVRRLLKRLEYGLYSNRKSLTGPSHPDRDKQFRYIRRIKTVVSGRWLPVISVDTKKKELIGNFLNQGRSGSNNRSKLMSTIFVRMHWAAPFPMVFMT